MNENLLQSGIEVDEYVRTISNYRSFVRALMNEPEPNDSHVADFRALAEPLDGPLRATIMTEDWCGDSACTLPVLARFFAELGIELRILRGSEHSDLKDHYERDGVDHIPVISVWDGRFAEVVRWVECPKSIDARKEAWKAERPQFTELYARQKKDPAAAKEFATLYRSLLDAMAEWYRDGGWDDVTAEIVAKMRG